MHLHDNHGHNSADAHLALGAGVIDVAPAIAVAQSAGASIVLEHKSEADVHASLRYLRARGLLGSDERSGALAEVAPRIDADEAKVGRHG